MSSNITKIFFVNLTISPFKYYIIYILGFNHEYFFFVTIYEFAWLSKNQLYHYLSIISTPFQFRLQK